jgi:hypothetical protein
MNGPRKNVWILLLLSVALWLAAVGPAYLIAGARGFEGLTYSVLLCLVPGLAALECAERGRGANRAMEGLLIGMGLRFAAILGVTFVLSKVRPDLGLMQFYIWLILAYLGTLAVETRLLLQAERSARPAEPGTSMSR